MEMRSHLAFLLPHGLESKEFRFGVHQPLPARQKVYRKDTHYFVISKFFHVIS